MRNYEVKKAVADAVGYTGPLEDHIRFAQHVAEWESLHPGEFQRICQEIVRRKL
jgi:hypothetical protein